MKVIKNKFFLGGIVIFLIGIAFFGTYLIVENDLKENNSSKLEKEVPVLDEDVREETEKENNIPQEEIEQEDLEDDSIDEPATEENKPSTSNPSPVIPQPEPTPEPQPEPTPEQEVVPEPEQNDNQAYLDELAKVEYTDYQVCMDEGFKKAFSDTVNILGFSCRDVYWQGQVIGFYLKLDYTNPMGE